MTLQDLIDNNLGIHQRICRLIGLRKIFTNKNTPYWIIIIHEALTTEILILLRSLLSKGKNSDDICIQKLLWIMHSKDKITKNEYDKKLARLMRIQKKATTLKCFIDKNFAHITQTKSSLKAPEEFEVDEIVEDISNFLETDVYPYFSKKDNIPFQARISDYEDYWKETKNFLIKNKIIHEIRDCDRKNSSGGSTASD